MGLVRQAMANHNVASFDELGAQLCERFPDQNWPKPRSLGVKLGELDRGRTDWWLKRDAFVEKLTAFLECSSKDLGLHAADRGRAIYSFDDFPELRPLDLTRESPCDIGYWTTSAGDDPDTEIRSWFGSPVSGLRTGALAPGVTWLHIPSGTGRTLFWERLKRHSPYACRTASTVASAREPLAQAQAVCLYVSDSAGERDALALAHKHPECAVLVCAPFEFQEREDRESKSVYSWTYQTASTDERARLRLTQYGPFVDEGTLKQYRWQLHADWRSRLLQWIDRRLGEQGPGFDPQHIERWLAESGDQNLIDTPADLIAICRFAHRFGSRNLPRMSERIAGGRLLELIGDSRPDGRADFKAIVVEWLMAAYVPWGRSIDARSWRGISSASRHPGESDDLIEAIAQEADGDKRRMFAEQIKHRLSESPRPDLSDTEFLHQNHLAEWQLRPRFLAHLVARDELVQQIIQQPHTAWGHLYFDATRRPVVDDALALLTAGELNDVCRRLLTAESGDAASIGAAEALFCAVGFRAMSDTPPDAEVLENLGARVIERLNGDDVYMPPQAWTSINTDRSAWQAVCWAWGLTTSQVTEIPEEWSAYFPGWFRKIDAPDWTFAVTSFDADRSLPELASSDRLLVRQAQQVVDVLAPLEVDAPGVLIPDALVRCVTEEARVPDDWWAFVLNHEWASEMVEHRMGQVSGDLTSVLVSFTEAVVSMAKNEELNAQARRSFIGLAMVRGTALRKTLFERSNAAAFWDAISTDAHAFICRNFVSLPTNYQLALLEQWQSHPKELNRWWFHIAPAVHAGLIDALVPWIEADGKYGIIVPFVWNVFPEKAKEMLTARSGRSLKRALILGFDSFSDRTDPFDSALVDVVGILEHDAELLSELERREWVTRQLPRSGWLAPRLLALLPTPDAR
ncbi:hypothetical protein [Salinisphaera sp.]|uniref:hypothetical protein n=1 Tax=Salinisphaera sp. TaxID=1914330 RepID=UPI000C4F7B4E|nr:hypothetical protein [Salinisphaera sp.]MBS63162.1 hypothetical protein [Salinisphaera sp.]